MRPRRKGVNRTIGVLAALVAVTVIASLGGPSSAAGSVCAGTNVPVDREVNTDLNVEAGTLRASWTDDLGANQEVTVSYRDVECLRNKSVKRIARHAVETYIPVLEQHCADVSAIVNGAGGRSEVENGAGMLNVALARKHLQRWCDASLGGIKQDPTLR